MKTVLPAAGLLLVLLGCGTGSTGPVQESYPWEDFAWVQFEGRPGMYCRVSWAIQSDSLYLMGVQSADTSGYYSSNMPDIVGVDIYLEAGYYNTYYRDGIRAVTTSGSPVTDDWYEYYYPYGRNQLEQSIPYQPDIQLGGSNDVIGVYQGVLNGDTTVVFRKALTTGDPGYDIPIQTGSVYGAAIYLQWGEPGEPGYCVEEGEISPVEFL